MIRQSILGVILIMALTLTFTVNAQDFLYHGLAFNFLSGMDVELVALPDGKKYEGTIKIPGSFNLLNAKLIRKNAPAEVRAKVGINDFCKVVKIGDKAFKDCKNLIIIDMSTLSQVDIGKEAFAECTGLQEIIMTNTPIKISDRAFMNCSCRYLKISPNVTEIGDSAFFGMKVKIINIYGRRLKALGYAVFANSTVEYVSCGLNIIPDNTFRNCEKLRYIELSESLTEIGANAFSNCKSLKTFTAPPSLLKIRNNAFSGVTLDCVSLNNSDNEVSKDLFTGICGSHIPNLIMFPADKKDTYKKLCPEMFKKRVPILVTGNYNFWVYDGITDKEMLSYDALPIISQKVIKDFENDAEILVTSGSSISILLQSYKGLDVLFYSAVVNDTPMELPRLYLGNNLWDCPFNMSPHQSLLLLKDIKSPYTINIKLKD